MKRTTQRTGWLTAAASIMLLACATPDPVGGSTEESAGEDDSSSCAGADLQTDPMNCGSCGNECLIDSEDPSVGACVDGECGPLWAGCVLTESITCGEVCSNAGSTCVQGGCAGATYRSSNNVAECQNGAGSANAGSCDVLLQTGIYVQCCCAQ